ncbi:NAD(P)/FAD-dependent oxidoreductase [Flavobacterium rhizosphaerae]|uniref:NAD(P)/FAD-dependent oxidoreductase n=1 Tax=Flavobacterium rhizosphaerae TaxID=3163298 RepID=A0ABW8Z257_9FLAO
MQSHFDVIIIGGSYSGLSAAMALGRSLRNVLIIDSGTPCNRFTPHSHNFITHDGATPYQIAQKAKEQVLAYETVTFTEDLALSAERVADGFRLTTQKQNTYTATKILLATGVKDELPAINGLKDCWGISAIHCPYCHGYEYKHKATGILANGDAAFHYALLVHNLTQKLTVFTNGPKDFTPEQLEKLQKNNISVQESPVVKINHQNGYMGSIVLQDANEQALSALYVRPKSIQQTDIPQRLGCGINEQGYIITDFMQKTNIEGVYACGDCCTPMRAVSTAVAQGTMAGAAINMELCSDVFYA